MNDWTHCLRCTGIPIAIIAFFVGMFFGVWAKRKPRRRKTR